MMKALLAFLLLASTAFCGDTVAIRTQKCTQFGCENGAGSGVVIGKTDKGHYVIATAKHVIAGVQKASICVAENDWRPCTAIYPLPGIYDAGFVTLDYDGNLDAVDILEDDPSPGESMTFSGFSGGTDYEKGRGKIQSLGVARTTPRVQHGQSGGGVYDAEGRLIGIVNAYDAQGHLLYAPMGEVRKTCLREWKIFWGRCVPRRRPPQQQPPPDFGPVDPTPLPDAPIPLTGRDGKDGKDGRDGKDADEALILAMSQTVNQLKIEINSLRAAIAANDNEPEKPRLLYITSRNVDRVKATDTLARTLKNDGKRVTIITLDPKDIDEDHVRDVPRVYVLPSGRSVIGVDDVAKFLTDWKE
jgi:hypothetical protein